MPFQGFKQVESSDKQLGWNCFDIAVGLNRGAIDRASIVGYALKHANDIDMRQLLSPEIRHAAALTGVYLNNNQNNQHNHTEDLLPSIMHTDELRDAFKAYEAGYPDAFLEYCCRKDIFIKYIQYYYNKQNWFAFNAQFQGEEATGMIDIVAKMQQATIIVHHENGGEYRTNSYGTKIIHVGYRGGNHFVCLEPNKINLKRPLELSDEVSAEKVLVMMNQNDATANVPVMFSSPVRKTNKSGLQVIEKVDTPEQHLDLLQSAFINAQRYILITSYGIELQTFVQAGLFRFISAARKRGVAIQIYTYDMKKVDGRVKKFLEANGVLLETVNTHAKVLSYDDEIIAVGSYNWLSSHGTQYAQSENSSYLCRDKLAKRLIEDVSLLIYVYNDLYSNRVFNDKQPKSDQVDRGLIYPIYTNSTFAYLPTLQAHRSFIRTSFQEAEHRIIICSPFISSCSYVDFKPEILNAAVARGVQIYFICLNSQILAHKFRRYIAHISSLIHVIGLDNIHQKTFIVDNTVLAQGSFNWLSATRNESSKWHNLEATLVVKGDAAREFIKCFESSPLGQVVSTNESDHKHENILEINSPRRVRNRGG